jgi:hypothetical protein
LHSIPCIVLLHKSTIPSQLVFLHSKQRQTSTCLTFQKKRDVTLITYHLGENWLSLGISKDGQSPESLFQRCHFAYCIWLIVSIFHMAWFQPVCLQHTTYGNDIQLAMTTLLTILWFGLSINTAHAQTHSIHTVFKMTAIKTVGSSYKA